MFGISKAFWAVVVLTSGGVGDAAVVDRSGVASKPSAPTGGRRGWQASTSGTYVVLAYVGASVAAGLGADLAQRHRREPGVNAGRAVSAGPGCRRGVGRRGALGRSGEPVRRRGWRRSSSRSSTRCCASSALDNAWQYVVFGLAIVLGMLISGDRIADVIGRLLLRGTLRSLDRRRRVGSPDQTPPNRMRHD